MSDTQTHIVYRSRTEEALDGMLMDGSLAPILVAVITFLVVVVKVGQVVEKLRYRNKVVHKLQSFIVFGSAAAAAFIAFKVAFNLLVG
jgi:hypothetical protein